VGGGLALTWTANVFEIISYASRAFAPYYALQAMIAATGSKNPANGRALRRLAFWGWRLRCLAPPSNNA
jgi:hypothetical protein